MARFPLTLSRSLISSADPGQSFANGKCQHIPPQDGFHYRPKWRRGGGLNKRWTVGALSAALLCAFTIHYFFLKFKCPGDSTIRRKRNLPSHVWHAKLEELTGIAAGQMRCLNGQVAAHEQVIASANRVLANVFGGVYVERIGLRKSRMSRMRLLAIVQSRKVS
ncbi:hypothetical protein DFH08DRAFT_800142 [Mycena albidolilacea]|uniref:Uncharacterized protein n=1 Tax=Mycena albidolilacea TaxID=1033008 RepID=A0AAD7AJD7_9AGAR|nr:hypothetical protein DFH08DRAFT_800142 [Mycena albidolilacea]